MHIEFHLVLRSFRRGYPDGLPGGQPRSRNPPSGPPGRNLRCHGWTTRSAKSPAWRIPCCATSASPSATTNSPLRCGTPAAAPTPRGAPSRVWASKTAGATIRGEVLPGRAKALVLDDDSTQAALDRTNQGLADKAIRKLSHDHLGRIIDSVTSDVSSQIAAGNVLVFSELAPIFAALVQGLGADPFTPEALGRPHDTGPVLARERRRRSVRRHRLRRLWTRAVRRRGTGRPHPGQQHLGSRARTAPPAASHLGRPERSHQRHSQEADRDRHHSPHSR